MQLKPVVESRVYCVLHLYKFNIMVCEVSVPFNNRINCSTRE